MPRTLRGQVTLAFIGLCVGSIVLVSLLIQVPVQRHLALQREERMVEQARRMARILGEAYRPDRPWPAELVAALAAAQPPEVAAVEVRARGGVVWQSAPPPAAAAPVDVAIRSGTAVVGRVRLFPLAPGRLSVHEQHFRAGIVQGLWLSALAVGIVAVAAAAFVSGRLHRPLRAMTEVAQAMRAGDRDARAPRPAVWELRQLADALNDLAAWLQHSEALRRRLTRDIAHQLRTPLAVLRSQIEALRDGVWKPTPERIAACHGEVLALVRRLDDLDRMLEADTAVLALERAEITADELLDPLVTAFAPLFARDGVRFVYQPAGRGGRIRVDPDKTAQIVGNLLDNALKYTPRGGTVTLAAELTRRDLRITVRNTGPAIPPEELPRLFERFYRGRAARETGAPGSGLGLPIARALAEAHGGSVAVRSDEGGTEFAVTLPRGCGDS